MSRLIVVEKAIKIVEDCCGEVNPTSKALFQVKQLLDQLQQAVADAVLKPTEAGISLPGVSPSAAATLVKGLMQGTVMVPARLVGETQRLQITLPLAQIIDFARSIRGIAEAMQTLNFCNDLMGCVARGFRQNILPSKNAKRTIYLTKGFTSHFIPRGTEIPRKAKRHVRKGT